MRELKMTPRNPERSEGVERERAGVGRLRAFALRRAWPKPSAEARPRERSDR
jgi:hypothetical protein